MRLRILIWVAGTLALGCATTPTLSHINFGEEQGTWVVSTKPADGGVPNAIDSAIAWCDLTSRRPTIFEVRPEAYVFTCIPVDEIWLAHRADRTQEESWSIGDLISQPGQKLYRASECIGPIVYGVCHGSVIDTDPARPVCHGTMINGKCTGPLF